MNIKISNTVTCVLWLIATLIWLVNTILNFSWFYVIIVIIHVVIVWLYWFKANHEN